MKKKDSRNVYGKFGQLLFAALTAQTRFSVTVVVYAVIALLLLAYVSVEVLTGVLAQEIAELEEEREYGRESLNRLTSEYISLSSRAPVSRYCESVLGMVEGREGNFERFVVDDLDRFGELIEITERSFRVTGAQRFTSVDKEGTKEP